MMLLLVSFNQSRSGLPHTFLLGNPGTDGTFSKQSVRKLLNGFKLQECVLGTGNGNAWLPLPTPSTGPG